MPTVELLSPAGTLKNMRYAFAYGADAVYAGQPRYSLRVRNNDFLEHNLSVGIAEAHALGKKFYLAVNVLPHNSKIKTFIKDIGAIVEMQPDALIMADPGLIMLAREAWPHVPVHLSVQANTMNYASVKFWQSVGISRIILSRELSLWMKSPRFASNALTWNWRPSYTARYASPIPGAACYQVISTTATRIKALAPIHAAGNMTLFPRRKTPRGILSHPHP